MTAVGPAPGGGVDWSTLRRRFRQARWDFADESGTPGGELHPYPARFIPALPAQALAILEPQGQVLDPFCGSGTTLHVAQRCGLAATGNDLNPIACLLSRVRTSAWRPGDASAAEHHATAMGLVARAGSDSVVPIPRVDHWFPTWAQTALGGAVAYLGQVDPADPWRDRLALAVSACVVRLSRQDSDTRYAAVEKGGNLEYAVQMLSRSVLRVASWLREHSVPNAPVVRVFEGDARSLPQVRDHSVSAAIFSPPYPNAYEYWLYHKYRMYWLGHDPVSVRMAELGARPHYCKANGLTAVDFERQMSDVFAELARVLWPGAPAVVVIGDSIIGGRWIDNAEVIEAAAAPVGWEVICRQDRQIRRARSSFNAAHSRGRKTEHVLLLRSPM